MTTSALEPETPLQAFANHVAKGLQSNPKKLSSRYFYDDEGSRIFQQIMQLPEYYLTRAEDEILSTQASAIMQDLALQEPFNIIELGAGDGAKTQHLLRAFQASGHTFDFIPIDISSKAIDELLLQLPEDLQDIPVKPLVGDYFAILPKLVKEDRPDLVLFLGSNIGNFEYRDAVDFLSKIHDLINKGDHLLIGFDLMKNPNLVRAAYFDDAGITKNFNLNLLRRINRELSANFNLDQFDFYAYYNPVNGEVRSFIVSLVNQIVRIKAINRDISFTKGEIIQTELSKKYNLGEIRDLATAAGFETVRNFFDGEDLFTDALWRAK